MGDKWNALDTFWNGFSVPAYDENTVPDGASMPYITYEASIGSLEDKITLLASIWYYSTSWADISAKAKEIEEYIGGGVGVRYDSGRMWVTKGFVFAQRMNEPGSDLTRRIVLNIEVEFQ